MGFLIGAQGLSCSIAHGVFDPRPGIELGSPVMADRFLTTGSPGKSPTYDCCNPGILLIQYTDCIRTNLRVILLALPLKMLYLH